MSINEYSPRMPMQTGAVNNIIIYNKVRSPRNRLLKIKAQPRRRRNRLSWPNQAHCNGNASTEQKGTCT